MHEPQRRDHDSGRVAVPEIAELLHLQRPAAAVAAAAVVLLGLLVTLVAPGVLPANVVTGAAVGLLALVAAVATAVLLDGRDPVLRGPRHLRRDGHAVLARMAGPDPVQHGAPVLAALERRLEGRDHLGVVLTGTGSDPSDLAVTLGRAAAADGHTALVIDLRAPGAPGVADVGEGTVRLGEAARLADDRPYAWIGAGVDRDAAASAAAGVARRPPRDLKLLLVVAPDAATHVPEVLRACDRTILLVAADSQQRAMVTARLQALERAGGRPEAVVVGGLRVVAEQSNAIDDGPGTGMPAAAASGPAADAASGPAAAAPSAATATAEPATTTATPPAPPATEAPAEPQEEPEAVVPPSPAPSVASDSPEPEGPAPVAPPVPEPDAPRIQIPDPEAEAPDPVAEDDTTTDERDQAADERDRAPDTVDARDPLQDTGPLPPAFRTAAPATREPARRELARREPATREPAAREPATPEPLTAASASVGDTDVEGMAPTDALLTVAALDQLVTDRARERDAG